MTFQTHTHLKQIEEPLQIGRNNLWQITERSD